MIGPVTVGEKLAACMKNFAARGGEKLHPFMLPVFLRMQYIPRREFVGGRGLEPEPINSDSTVIIEA